MITLNDLKNQFGEILTREQLKKVYGGLYKHTCTAECPGTAIILTCEGESCEANDGIGCSSINDGVFGFKICPPISG